MGKGIRARGDSIVIDFAYMGVRCRETIRLAPTKQNLAYAERLKGTILTEIEKGTFRYSNHFPTSKRCQMFGENATITVKDALEAYLHGLAKSAEGTTLRDYWSAANHHLIPTFGDLRLRSLTTAKIRTWIASLTVTNKRINNVMVPLRGMLKDAYADGMIDRDPCARIKALEVRQDDPDPFTASEIDAILEALPPMGANMMRFAFWTGMRTGELIALRWEDVDFIGRTVNVRRSISRGIQKRPKSKAGERIIELLPEALDALQAQKEHSFMKGDRVWLNPRSGRPWEWDQQIRQYMWQPALKRAGVRYRTPYQTRHTFASTLLSAGANPMWVAKQMGHSDWGMIRKRYGRWIPSESSEADRVAALLGQRCDEIVTKRRGTQGD